MKKYILAISFLLVASPAFAICEGQWPGGSVCNNGSTSQGNPSPSQAITLGVPGSARGSISLSGATSGKAIIIPQASAGTPTITLPNTSGTLPSNVTSPLVLGSSNGNISCPTCVTGSSGSLAVGTTGVTGAAAGKVLYTDGAFLQAYSVTGSGSSVLNNSPSLLTPGLLSSGTGAFNLTLQNTENLTAGRSLTFTVNDANRVLSLGNDFYTSGNYSTTLTSTNTTNSTLPAGTHTLSGLDVAQTWSALQQYNDGDFALKGATSGTLTQKAPAVAGSSSITWPAGTTDFSATGGGVLQQATAGAPFTVGIVPLIQGGLGGSQAGATIGQVPAFPGSGGPAVPTTLVYFASTFGVKCDGSTDDYAASVALINYVHATTGGIIQYPAGVCLLSSGISTSNLSDVTIRGAGHAATTWRLKNTAVNNYVLLVSNVTNTEIDGISFDNANLAGSYPNIQFTNSTNIRLKDIQAIHSVFAGGAFDSVQNAWVNDSSFERDSVLSTENYAFIIASSGVASANITFENTKFKNAGVGIDGNNIKFLGGECDHFGFGTCLNFNSTVNTYNNIVSNFYAHDGQGVDVNNTASGCIENGGADSSFSNFICERVAGTGIGNFGKRVKIDNVVVKDCGMLPVGYTGTSTTANTISGVGSYTWTTQTGLAFTTGQYLVVFDTSNGAANALYGNVTSYNSGTGQLVFNATLVRGSGTISAWTIYPGSYSPVGFLNGNVGGIYTASDTQITNSVVKDTGGGTCLYGYGEYYFGTVSNAKVNWNDFSGAVTDWYAPATSIWPLSVTTRFIEWDVPTNTNNWGILWSENGRAQLSIPPISMLGTFTTHGVVTAGSSALTSTVVMTDGQILVGQTGADPLPKTMSSDATLANTGALTLASVITAGGPTGGSTSIPVITYDAKGRLTTVTTATPTVTAVNGVSYPASYTQGGIPWASGTSAISSSTLLTANNLMVGGGDGAAPSTVTTGSGVLTALGNTAGGAGGFALVPGTWTSYSPTITCAVGALSGGSYTTQVGRYNLNGKTLSFTFNVQYSAIGSCSGQITVSLPTGTPQNWYTPVSAWNANSGNSTTGYVVPGTAKVRIINSNGADPAGTDLLFASGIVELQ